MWCREVFKYSKYPRARALWTSTKQENRLWAIIVPEMANNLDNQAILRRVGRFFGEQQPICPNSILLNASKTTTFGRTVASNVRLLSCKVPLMISRKHASVIFQDEKWMIIDHNVSGFVGFQQIFVAATKLQRKRVHNWAGIFVIFYQCSTVVLLRKQPRI